MIVYEIENMETGDTGHVTAPTEWEMKKALIEKGFTDCGEFLAGINPKGEEVSAMSVTFRHVKALKPFSEQ